MQGTGEPLLNKNIPEAFHEAARQKLPVSLTTNGVLLDKPLAREILPQTFSVLFSNVVPDKERYVHMHDCPENHYDKVVDHVRQAVELRTELNLKVALRASLYLDAYTIDNLPQYLTTLKEFGIDYVMVSEPLWTSGSFDGVRPTSQETMRNKTSHIDELLREAHELRDDDFQFNFKLLVQDAPLAGMSPDDWEPGRCDGVKFYTIVASDGEVYPCWRYWGNREFSYGSLHRDNLRSILEGGKAQEVYRHLNATPPESDECQVCALTTINCILNQLKAPTPWINFM